MRLAYAYVGGGQLRRILYTRATGMIDLLPELNPDGVNMADDLAGLGLLPQ